MVEMNDMELLAIQNRLRQEDSICIPQLQLDYGLTYRQAKLLLQGWIRLGWLSREVNGNLYAVQKENLRLRRIRREENEEIIEGMNEDTSNALGCIRDGGLSGATFDDISEEVRGDDDTEKALDFLLKQDLIYCYDEKYFLCVSARAVQILQEIASAKRMSDMTRRFSSRSDNPKSLQDIFDRLFED